MKTNRKELVLLLCLLFLLLGSTVPALAGEQVTIWGTVNASYQIVTEDQQVYDVAESEQGDEVVVYSPGGDLDLGLLSEAGATGPVEKDPFRPRGALGKCPSVSL